MSDNMNRVFIWAVPRTVSTALLKCLSFVEGLQGMNEVFGGAFYDGPERKCLHGDPDNPLVRRLAALTDNADHDGEIDGFDGTLATYAWIRDKLLEAPYQGKKILLCKEMGYHLDARYHILPRSFTYSFLIRHPAKVFPSWKEMLVQNYGEECRAHLINLLELPEYVFPAGYGFRELYELMEYVEKHLGQKPVVLDMDDLLADPPGLLAAYCREVGIPYGPELLSWEAGDDIARTWISPKAMVYTNEVAGMFGTACQSTGFGPPKPVPSRDTLPADVQACIDASMGYYEKMHRKRIQPSSATPPNF